MPSFIRIRFLLSLLPATKIASAGVSVLFVGNSLTQVNDLPTAFKHFAAESTIHADVDVRAITAGGATLYDHWKREQTRSLLRNYRPNFLVLQGQSTEPLSAPQNFNYYARLFKTEADQLNTRTVLFETWARPGSDPYYKDASSGGSPAEMQTRLNAAYAMLARNIAATLAPVGVAWQRAEQIAPNIQLLDGSQHPSHFGTYLAAAVLFRTIFNAPAMGSTYYDALPQPTARTLQQIADQVPITRSE